MKGLESELTKSKRPIAHIRRTRIAQGRMERKELSDGERAEVAKVVLERWSAEYKKWWKRREQELQKHQKGGRVRRMVRGDAEQQEKSNGDAG